jgi:hypothetical protein
MKIIDKEVQNLKGKTGVCTRFSISFNAWTDDEKDKIWAALIYGVHKLWTANVPLRKRLWATIQQNGSDAEETIVSIAIFLPLLVLAGLV